ncbi:CLUMA_CG017795, isoform A [Clunio marinus]|uniref:CLUMA_CG017795, isoform A n=1 Tax=Clunio marinus TaxID=568069 RepID=A0A1J1IX60_9DIPT|nr:CLUMA_CG017795, isoform A [Clunio marinus]
MFGVIRKVNCSLKDEVLVLQLMFTTVQSENKILRLNRKWELSKTEEIIDDRKECFVALLES